MNKQHAYYFIEQETGYLKITGQDRLDFIQRQTTNDVLQLMAGSSITTVLTNPSARIVDILQLFELDANTIAAITLPGRGETTADFLRRRIFFMDQVTVENLSDRKQVIELGGDESARVFEHLSIDPPAPSNIIMATIADRPVRVYAYPEPKIFHFRLIADKEDLSQIVSVLQAAGLEETNKSETEIMRIEAGLAGPEGEFIDQYTPLETGLDSLISETKGCYTGQEIIARQITYDKVTRGLVGVELEQAASPGAKILVSGSIVGAITSSVKSPVLGHIALAVVKKAMVKSGVSVTIQENGDQVNGLIVELPFKSQI